jgi:hypothetical protein
VKRRRNGRVVIQHLAALFPFAGVMWQLLHHLIGLRDLGLDVYYLEDHATWVYDPHTQSPVHDPSRNLQWLSETLDRFGFGDRWAFFDTRTGSYLGMSHTHCLELLREADVVINLCGATEPREEHQRCRCLVYLQTDPGKVQIELEQNHPRSCALRSTHQFFFTYGYNIGADDCRLPTGGVRWRPTRPPVVLGEWQPNLAGERAAFGTVCTWHNKGMDVEIGGEKYFWSKDVNFRKFLEVARRANQPIELATDLSSGPDYDRALQGGFTIVPAVPMSLDLDLYRGYVTSSRGEFTAAKDIYARTRSGWFSDRSVCYLAAGRPVVTQRTGFEKYIPEGCGLMGFDTADEAVEAIRAINADYPRHSRVAREIAMEYFDASTVLSEIAETVGL